MFRVNRLRYRGMVTVHNWCKWSLWSSQLLRLQCLLHKRLQLLHSLLLNKCMEPVRIHSLPRKWWWCMRLPLQLVVLHRHMPLLGWAFRSWWRRCIHQLLRNRLLRVPCNHTLFAFAHKSHKCPFPNQDYTLYWWPGYKDSFYIDGSCY